MKRYRNFAGHCLAHNLSMKNGNGPWDTVFYSAKTGYFLSGAYGALHSLPKELGRLYMKGLATPVFWPGEKEYEFDSDNHAGHYDWHPDIDGD